MSDLRETLGVLELDALREATNIGSGHAATALSQLTNQHVRVSVARVTPLGGEGFDESFDLGGEEIAGASMQIFGSVTGQIWFVQPESHARMLGDFLLGLDAGTTTEFDEMVESCFKEVANILAGAYLNALSRFLKLTLMPSVPSFSSGDPDAVLTGDDHGRAGANREMVLCTEATLRFGSAPNPILGFMVLFPDPKAVDAILDALHEHIRPARGAVVQDQGSLGRES